MTTILAADEEQNTRLPPGLRQVRSCCVDRQAATSRDKRRLDILLFIYGPAVTQSVCSNIQITLCLAFNVMLWKRAGNGSQPEPAVLRSLHASVADQINEVNKCFLSARGRQEERKNTHNTHNMSCFATSVLHLAPSGQSTSPPPPVG